MSSFFDSASLVQIPSGYSDGTLYSVKPIDGSGDLTFTRSIDSATRVASNGLIERVRTNQVQQSETLDNAYWNKTNVSVTANAIANPLDGALTAELLTVTDPSGPVEKTIINGTQSYTAGTPYTISAYFKAGTISTNFKILAYDGVTLYQSGIIDLATIGNSTAPYEDVGGGWYRFRFTFTPANSTATGIVYLVNYAFGVVANTGTNVYVYGAQIETGDIATDYIATTSAAVSVGPVANLPRLDYSGGATCPKLLLEPQRTNVITNNNDFATGAANVTVLSNNATSPEGYQNADLITGDAGTLTKSVNFSGASAGAYTLSVFAKYNTQQWIQLAAGGIATYANFDIQNGVLGTTNGTSQIEDYGNGWYRCSVNLVSGTPLSFVVFLVTNGTSARFSTTTSTGSFWAYGIQSEIGAYPTSVIPTLGAALTRGADAASKTSATALIGQTEGTLFVEFVVDSSSSPTMAFFVSAAGVFDNAIWIQQNASDSVIFRVFSGTTEQCSITKTGLTNGQTVKIAGAYKANDFVLYVNGVQVGTDNSGTIPSSLSQLEIGSYAEVGSPYNQNRPVSQALLFKTRLSNADLAALTA
jgi:hypothetical protein